LDEGFKEVVELKLPALIAVQSGINEPRYASLSKIKMARSKPINIMSARDIKVSHELISRWRKFRIESMSIAEAKKTEFLKGNVEEVALTLAKLIIHIIRE
ncbi:hypothetical protein KEJ32_07070, partial [Candidatus Bathyarchaeota archaeon]|nr:hypothetical protein [Candidatus Bathyarchaeota archaeon]